MSILVYQRARIAAALRSILRAGNGLNLSPSEIRGRTQNYLIATTAPDLSPSNIVPKTPPLFRDEDYSVVQSGSLLGGLDGKDISRGWSAVREDLDTVEEVENETSRRITQAITLLRSQAATLSTNIANLQTQAASVQNQIQNIFFGGAAGTSAAGQGTLTWNVSPNGDNLIYPETTGITLPSNLGIIPTQGSAAGSSNGGNLIGLTLISTSQGNLVSGSPSAYFVEQPATTTPSAWNFNTTGNVAATITIMPAAGDTVSALQVGISPGVTLQSIQYGGTSVAYQTVATSSTLWVVFSTPIQTNGQNFTLAFIGAVTSNQIPVGPIIGIGSISSLLAHSFSCNAQASLVWGPFSNPDGSNPNTFFVVSIADVQTATPQGTVVEWDVSPYSADGPWISFGDKLSPVVLSQSGQGNTDLFPGQATPDSITQGFYKFPFTNAGSLYNCEFSAGNYQANGQAYNYNWLQNGEVAHQITPSDWTNPQGTPSSVALGAGPVFIASNSEQSFTGTGSAGIVTQGTCLCPWTDSNGNNLTYILLRDDQNSAVLQPGYNYQFTFGIYCPSPTYLSNQPIGIFNPNGQANFYACPIMVTLNGNQVYQGDNTFQDFNEVNSSAPSGVYTNPWPPYCGRMNLALKSGWNTLQIMVYIPNMTQNANGYNPAISLESWSGIVFGPGLFQDSETLLLTTGIQIVRGWPTPWTQVSEFTLRQTTATMVMDCWAWEVDPSTQGITSILLNHNPSSAETGFSSLDGYISGQPRNHNITYTPQTVSSNPKLWLRALLSSNNPNSTPFVSGATLIVN